MWAQEKISISVSILPPPNLRPNFQGGASQCELVEEGL